MKNLSTIYKLSLVAITCLAHACSCSCPLLECWFVQEKAGQGRGMATSTSQEKSLLHIRTDPRHEDARRAPSDINPDRVYVVNDAAATLCQRAFSPPSGSIVKPECEINPFLPQPSSLSWVAPLTEPAFSPVYLQADWFAATVHGYDGQLGVSTITRAPTGSKEHDVILSVTSRTISVQARLGEEVLLDCGFWADAASPLHGLGFAVEWRYQFRGSGHLIVAYDSKTDRLFDFQEEDAELDIEGLHESRNASLVLKEAKVHHSGMYICSVYLPFLLAQVTLNLEVVEPPSLSIHPSPLPLTVPGQSLTVYCKASRFAPHSLEFSWEFEGPDGKSRSLGPGSVTGHRQASDGTFSQTTRLDLDTSGLDLVAGGQLICGASHLGGSQQARVALNVIGLSVPSVEDSMAMVGVALALYGLIKFVCWTFPCSGAGTVEMNNKKDK